MQSLFAMALCLLALTFAVEAKLAWYMPPHTMGSEVQATKAMPADVPQLILHGLPDQHPMSPRLSLTALLLFLMGSNSAALSFYGIHKRTRPPISDSSFSHCNFLRPPPTR
jgi:hypothetical protein